MVPLAAVDALLDQMALIDGLTRNTLGFAGLDWPLRKR
jgi:hypothetical protein